MTMWTTLLVLFGAAVLMVQTNPTDVEPLDMAPNSVDDMYNGCEKEMMDKVKEEFLQNEINTNENFAAVWNEAGKKKLKTKNLSQEQYKAIFGYTLEKPQIYDEFNDAVQIQKDRYRDKFQFHSQHFFLTSGLKVLNSRKSEEERCLTGYRRSDKKYDLSDVLNKEIRFGIFASSSKGDYLKKTQFGEETCFEIYTCLGPDISLFSKFESEREVLVPPYEIFKVTKIEKKSENKSLPCNVVVHLKSTEKYLSNLNCAFFPTLNKHNVQGAKAN